MSDNENDKPKEIKVKLYIGIAFFFFLLILVPYIIKFKSTILSFNVSELGTLGDYMGGTLNPMLAFLSFIALLYTIKLQSKELALSTKELHETQKATRDSATALEEQSKSIKLQNFENTFFNMLNLHIEITRNMVIKEKRKEEISEKFTVEDVVLEVTKERDYVGKEAISILFVVYQEYIKKHTKSYDIRTAYNAFYREYNNLLGHYFRNIYQILKFINIQKDENLIDKKLYTNILRAQLSNTELALLLINALSIHGSKKLLPLLIKYEFMEPLPIKIIDNNYLKKLTTLCILHTKHLNNPSYKKWKIFGSKKEWKSYINRFFKDDKK